MPPAKPTLFDIPLSPYGGRIRYYIYKYNLRDTVDIKSPSELGGMKSDEYMALHPVGKAPLLVLPSGQAIPESAIRLSTMYNCALQWSCFQSN
jgi:glutathione S-transferase